MAKEKSPQPISLKDMTFDDLQRAQEELRRKGSPTIPFIDTSKLRLSYPQKVALTNLVRGYGLDSQVNVGLEGVTAFVDTEEDFENLKRFIQKHPEYTVRLPD